MLKVESPVALSAYIENEDIDNQKPFVISGHHLYLFSLLKYKSPTVIAKSLKNSIVSQQQEYMQDVLGSLEDAPEFEDRIKLILSTFIKLPDDHPAEIVEGIPDVICNACVVGKHCKTNTLGLDGRRVDGFIAILEQFNFPKQITIYEPANFSDVELQQARRIKTTIGIIKKAMQKTEPRNW